MHAVFWEKSSIPIKRISRFRVGEHRISLLSGSRLSKTLQFGFAVALLFWRIPTLETLTPSRAYIEIRPV